MGTRYRILDPESKRAAPSARALGIMVKAPQPGEVKTRLVPPLTLDEAAALSLCSLRDTAANIAQAAAREGADGVAVYTPLGSEALFADALPEGFSLLPQRGDSLGDRLLNATRDLLGLGYESVCLINSDSPTLPSDRITASLAALSSASDRVVLGPAEDGGYYLIGLKRAHPRLFADIDWSTEKVLSQTVARAAEIGLEVFQLPAWYDLDDAQTLSRLCDDLFSGDSGCHPYRASFTRKYLARLIETRGRDGIWVGETASRREWPK